MTVEEARAALEAVRRNELDANTFVAKYGDALVAGCEAGLQAIAGANRATAALQAIQAEMVAFTPEFKAFCDATGWKADLRLTPSPARQAASDRLAGKVRSMVMNSMTKAITALMPAAAGDLAAAEARYAAAIEKLARYAAEKREKP